MKIMLFSHLSGASYITGAEKYLFLLTQELSTLAECTLVVPQDGILKENTDRAGIPTRIEPYSLMWNLYVPDEQIAREEAAILAENKHAGLIQLLQLHRPDAVIVNTCVNALPAISAKELGIPVVWMVMENIERNEFTMQSVQLIDRYSDLIVHVSNHTRACFSNMVPADKLLLLPPSSPESEQGRVTSPQLQDSRVLTEGLPPYRFLIGYISAGIQRSKGLHHFLEMALRLCKERKDLCFLCIASSIGDFEYERQCLSMVEQSAFHDRFRFAGFQSDISSLYPEMSVVVIPSLVDEGFGMVALEALLHGTRTIAYRSGGLSEILAAAGQENLLVEKGDIDGLYGKVKSVLQEPSEAIDVRLIIQAFGIEAYKSRLAAFHETLRLLALEASERRKAAFRPLRQNRAYQGNRTQVLYVLRRGMKRRIASNHAIRLNRLRNRNVLVVTESQLYAYPTGEDIRFKSARPISKRRTRRRKSIKSRASAYKSRKGKLAIKRFVRRKRLRRSKHRLRLRTK